MTIATVAMLDEDGYVVARHKLAGKATIYPGQTLTVESRLTHEAGLYAGWHR